MKIFINNGYLEYEVTGNGIPLLLIHGYPLSRKMWDPQVNELADIATVITIDLRGHGESFPFDGPYTMEVLADDCVRVIDKIGIKTTILVCGLSMGGYITLSMYRKYPDIFAGMILTATRSGSDTSETKSNRDLAIKTAHEFGADRIAGIMQEKIVSPKTQATRPDLIKQIYTIMAKTSTNGIIGALQGMKDRHDSTPSLSQIKCPALIIHGEDDQLIPVHEAQVMYQFIPNSKLILIPDAGHLPNIEQPHQFNQAVREFIKSVV